jgi:hypothetical protein
MVHEESYEQLHSDAYKIRALVGAVAGDIEPALVAIEAAMEVFQAICSLAKDPQAMREENVRKALFETFVNTQRWLQSHHRFNLDMEEAAKTLFSNTGGPAR